jgi:hypothetical protein
MDLSREIALQGSNARDYSVYGITLYEYATMAERTGQQETVRQLQRNASLASPVGVYFSTPANPSTGSIYVTYTISEDRSGDQKSVLSQRLAALGSRRKYMGVLDPRFSSHSGLG